MSEADGTDLEAVRLQSPITIARLWVSTGWSVHRLLPSWKPGAVTRKSSNV